jgi:hypothetical protein
MTFVTALCLCVICPTGSRFEFVCRFVVKVGMTLEEAESFLGPGEEEVAPPWEDTGAVVTGDRFFCWERDGMEFHVGLKDGRVCSKWFWAPSL